MTTPTLVWDGTWTDPDLLINHARQHGQVFEQRVFSSFCLLAIAPSPLGWVTIALVGDVDADDVDSPRVEVHADLKHATLAYLRNLGCHLDYVREQAERLDDYVHEAHTALNSALYLEPVC